MVIDNFDKIIVFKKEIKIVKASGQSCHFYKYYKENRGCKISKEIKDCIDYWRDSSFISYFDKRRW